MEPHPENEPVRWSGRSLKRRAKELLSKNYGTLFILGVISVLVGDWMGGWLRIQFQVGPLHDPFQFPIFVTKKPCKEFGPKLRMGVPVDLLASPEWPAVRDRFGLFDPNELGDGLEEKTASDSLEQWTGWRVEDGTMIHRAWNADSWRVVRLDPGAAAKGVTTNGDAGASIEFHSGQDLSELSVTVDSYEFRFRRAWHVDLFGKPVLALRSPWAVAAFMLAGMLFFALVCNPLSVAIRGALLDEHRGGAGVAPPRPPLRWAHAARVLLLQDVALLLWTLLLVVPGFVKAYEWRLVPFLLADDPLLSWRDAARTSGERMRGHKLDAFLLDLSFAGWWILGGLTFGALNLLFTVPYYGLTLAGLYETLVRGLRLPPEPKTPYEQYQDAIQANTCPRHAAHAEGAEPDPHAESAEGAE